MSFKEIGLLFSLTRETIRKIFNKAMRKLKSKERKEKLFEFWEPYVGQYQEEQAKLFKNEDEERQKRLHEHHKQAIQRIIEYQNKEAEILAFRRKQEALIEKRLKTYQKDVIWWEGERDRLCESCSSKFEFKTFYGKCMCQEWYCSYPTPLNSFNLFCFNCLSKVSMTAKT